MSSINILDRLGALYGNAFLEMLFAFSRAAQERGVALYLVGGAVRDLLVDTVSEDIDLMLEGDAVEFVRSMHKHWSVNFRDFPEPNSPIVFPKYGTAKLNFNAEIVSGVSTLDFSSARQETYPHSGAQPIVVTGDLRADLKRRDFTINALAIRLQAHGGGELCDIFGGETDLAAKILRVLHKKSFIDDPARLIRAVRFAQRFDFQFEPTTAELFRQAVSEERLKLLPPFRLFDEFRKALSEKDAVGVLERLSAEGMLTQIHPEFRWTDSMKAKLPSGNWQASLRFLLQDLSKGKCQEALARFGLNRTQIAKITSSVPHAS